MNRKLFLDWADKTLKPFVEGNVGRFVLLLDYLDDHTTREILESVRVASGLAWFGISDATDWLLIWQSVDAGYAQVLKFDFQRAAVLA